MSTLKVKDIVLGSGKPKICVSVIENTSSSILNQCKKLSEEDVDIVEWRCDFFEDISTPDKICELLKNIKLSLNNKPLIFTVRSKEEGGNIFISEEDYISICEYVCKSKLVDIIDIEMKIGDKNINKLVSLAHKNQIKVIISKHDFKKTPSKEEILNTLIKMQDLKADIPKIAVMPNDYLDVTKLLEATAIMKKDYNKTPIITIAMGEKGLISRLSGQVFGSCLTFASGEKASAPGQIKISDMNMFLNLINKYQQEEKNTQNVILIGFMGTGKSSISSELAEILNKEIIDTDNYIEELEKTSINNIFKTKGEEYFRKCETDVLKELCKKNNLIVSCGGGIILKEENIELLKKIGQVVLLTATPETIYNRIKSNTERPLLNSNMNIDYISSLMEKRKEKYIKASDIIIETDNKSIKQICGEIVKRLG